MTALLARLLRTAPPVLGKYIQYRTPLFPEGKAILGFYSPGVKEVPCGTSSAVGEYLSQGQGYPFPTYLTRGLALYARDTQLCKAMNMRKEVWPSQLGPNVIGHNAAFLAPHVLGSTLCKGRPVCQTHWGRPQRGNRCRSSGSSSGLLAGRAARRD
jgi:hypothetical protein